LVIFVGIIPCPIPSTAAESSSGLQDQFLENPDALFVDFEPCSSGLFSDTIPKTGESFFDEVFVEDLKIDSPEDSGEKPEGGSDRGVDSSTPVSQPIEKRKRVKMVAIKSSPRTSKPSAPVIEEISSSSSSLSGSDSEDPSFK